MAQEFTINSTAIENKINQLLPSQGGFGAGIDFSASTMVIPIVDLTESAEGSSVRQDLQTAFSFNNISQNFVSGSTSALINTTGYWRLFGNSNIVLGTSSIGNQIVISDGVSNKNLFQHECAGGSSTVSISSLNFDFVCFVDAGDSISALTSSSKGNIAIAYRQIADISGNLV